MAPRPRGESNMLVVDELKKNDPQLRLVAILLVTGFLILLAGLWWVQVVSSRKYQSHQETQAYRTIRIPAMRGKILDREGRVLADEKSTVVLKKMVAGQSASVEGTRQ